MALQTFHPPGSSCEVFTYKEGLLSRVAHDLCFEVTTFTVKIEGDRIDAVFDARSLRCLHALKKHKVAPRALSEKDRDTIDLATRDEVLAAARFPEITFRGESTREDEGVRVLGLLALHGVERRVSALARRSHDRWVADFDLLQPDFGIHPFTAMMGALKVKPGVRVRITLGPAPA